MTSKWKNARKVERFRHWRMLRRCRWVTLERCRRSRIRKKRICSIGRYQDDAYFRISSLDRGIAQEVGRKGFVNPQGVKRRLPKGTLVLVLPEVFDFEKNYNESARLIAIFRRALLERKRISYIDFSRLNEVSPACVMVFTCYVDLWKDTAPRISPAIETWKPNIVKAFREVGFFRLLGFACDRGGAEDSSIRYMNLSPYLVNDATQRVVNTEVVSIRRRIEEFVGEALDRRVIYQSISEAILNVYNHAYGAGCPHKLTKKWWLSVSFDDVSRDMTVILFDHGLGIPTTILQSSKFSWYREFYYKINKRFGEDTRLWLAFERLRNKRAPKKVDAKCGGRGRGCKDVLQMVMRTVAADVSHVGNTINVISSHARYRYTSSGDPTKRGESVKLATPLQGTLIEWRIKI